MSHIPMLVVTTCPTPSMVFPERPWGKRGGVGEGVPKTLRNPQTSWDPQNPAGGA